MFSFLFHLKENKFRVEESAYSLMQLSTPANKVFAIYGTQFGCYGKLIRSDQFIYLVCWSVRGTHIKH